MRRFKNPYLLAVFTYPESLFEGKTDEVLGSKTHKQKTLCTSNFHAISIIADYVLRHDPFQRARPLQPQEILKRLDDYNRLAPQEVLS